MKQPIAIFGSGELGLALAESLRDLDRHLTLYDYHQARVAAAQAKGFNAKVLDFQSDEQLKQAGKVTPAMEDRVVALLSLSDDKVKLESGDKTERMPVAEIVKSLLEDLPAQFKLEDEKGTTDKSDAKKAKLTKEDKKELSALERMLGSKSVRKTFLKNSKRVEK